MFSGVATSTFVHDRQHARLAATHDHRLAAALLRPPEQAHPPRRTVRSRAAWMLVRTGLRLGAGRGAGEDLGYAVVRATSAETTGFESCRSAAVLARVRC